MRFVVLFYSITMLLVTSIMGVAMIWVRFSHLRLYEGPLLLVLWSTHGVHLFDLVVLAIEVLLLLALSIILLAGFSHQRR